ncbi:hypothetical protein ACMAY5_08020 [Arenicellales bacterium nBUS_48]
MQPSFLQKQIAVVIKYQHVDRTMAQSELMNFVTTLGSDNMIVRVDYRQNLSVLEQSVHGKNTPN